MVDRLRLFLNRPLSDADRPRLFAIAVAIIVAAAACLALTKDADPHAQPVARRSVTPAPSIAAPARPAAQPSASTPGPPSEEGTAASSAVASRADVAAAKRAARRFLAGYLPYSYGQASADEIRGAQRHLLRTLARERPRVPARERRRRPRVVLLQSDGVTHEQARVIALVGDGARRYSVSLELARSGGVWKVTQAGR